MIKIYFQQSDIEALQDLQKNHPHHHARKKAMALLMKNQRISHWQIAKALDIQPNTLRAYFKAYIKNGIKSVTTLNFKGPNGSLAPFEEIIKKHLDTKPPATVKQACEEIYTLTGVRLRKSQMRIFLKSLGARFRKLCGIPAKADPVVQKAFLEKEMQPRLDEAIAGKRVVFYVDAAHFVLAAFLGFVWSIKKLFIRTPSGRQRYNVLAALNATTKELITVTNDAYITATQVCELLGKIAQMKYALPITIVLDNARYQRCKAVIDLANELGIELLFLPPYSPNLNLIERVWKFTRRNCLNGQYFANFGIFRNAIDEFLGTMHETRKAELQTLLTLNFQTFTEDQIIPAA